MVAGIDISLALQQLELYNEKADKLEQSRFLQAMLHETVGYRLSRVQTQGALAEYFGPEIEAVEAFVLTFRFFIQRNEISIHDKMHQVYTSLHAASLISDSTLQQFLHARDQLCHYLDDMHPNPMIEINSVPLTRRAIMETFIYGGLAHATKKAQYDEWETNPPLFTALQVHFAVTLTTVLQFILCVRQLNAPLIDQLRRAA